MNQHTGLQLGDAEWLLRAIETKHPKLDLRLAHSVKYSLGWLPGILIVTTTPSQEIYWN